MKADIKDKHKSGIYCIINKLNNKMYIGKAKCIHSRIKSHIANCNTKSLEENRYLINSWHKHGRDNFDYFVLEYLNLEETLLSERELYWQQKYNVTNRRFGYNLRLDSSTRMITHKSTRILISKRLKKEWKNGVRKNHGEKLANNWKTTPGRNAEQAKIMTKNLTKYRYKIYSLNNEFIEECFYIRLKQLGLANVQASYAKYNKETYVFKGFIIERLRINK